MGLYVFSSGVVVLRFLRNSLMVSRKLPTLQEASIKFDGSIKEMFGAGAHSEDAAGGSRKIQGTFKVGQIKGGQLAELFFGTTGTAGRVVPVIDFGGTAGTAPTSNTVNVGHTNITDLGVDSAVDGFPMDRVASAPTAGQYSVVESTGVYTFAAGDPRAASVRPSFRYTDSSAGKSYEMGNPLLGTIADSEAMLWNPRFTKDMGVIMYHAVITSLDLPRKREEYGEATMAYSCFNDPAKNSPGMIWTSDPD